MWSVYWVFVVAGLYSAAMYVYGDLKCEAPFRQLFRSLGGQADSVLFVKPLFGTRFCAA